jgi:hypothetical protein
MIQYMLHEKKTTKGMDDGRFEIRCPRTLIIHVKALERGFIPE